MLAELTPLETASIITGFVFGCIGLIIAGFSAFKKQQVAVDQPLNVALIEQFVTKDEFAQHVTQVNREIHQLREIFRVEIPQMERRIAEAGEGRVTKLHDRINEVLAEVSSLEGEIKQVIRNTQ